MKPSKALCSALLLLSLTCACEDADKILNTRDQGQSSIDKTTLEANRFVSEMMRSFYLWNDEMSNISYKTYDDTKEYFNDLKVEQDHFSFIVDNQEQKDQVLSGIVTTIGCYATAHHTEANSKEIVIVVRHVHKDSPAYKAGVKRGDLVTEINGQQLTTSNYGNLWDQAGVYKITRRNPDTEESEELTFRLLPTLITEDPATEFKVFDNGIAYLHYYSYNKDFNDKLTQIFNVFRGLGATDLILDLRYNTGGDMLAVERLCSLIAPQSNVDNGDELLWYKYNKSLSALPYYNRKDNASYFEQGATSMNLNRIVILTSGMSYSASESTIIALEPYMEVKVIGTQTGGKNQTMLILTPDIFTDDNNERVFPETIDNWLIAPIVATYYNSDDETFVPMEGIAPDFVIDEDDYFLRDLGSEKDPLIAAGIEYLTTGNVTLPVVPKSACDKESIEITKRFKGAIMPRR